MRAAAVCTLGGDDLGNHAPLAVLRPGPARHRFEQRITGTGFRNQGCRRVLARISSIKALLIGQDHQTIGFDQIGDQRPQCVVITKLDFVGHHGVIFVDDRHHTEFEQGFQGCAGIEITLAIRKVVVGQQYLRRLQAMPDESTFVNLRQLHLPDGRTGLQFMHGFRPFAPPQTLHAAGDGAGGNEQNRFALLAQLGNLARPVIDGVEIQSGTVVGDEGGTDLEDKSSGIGKACRCHGSFELASRLRENSGQGPGLAQGAPAFPGLPGACRSTVGTPPR